MPTPQNDTVKVQIDDLVREATLDEIANLEASALEFATQQAIVEAKAAARESALQKLAALGLTAEEIAAL